MKFNLLNINGSYLNDTRLFFKNYPSTNNNIELIGRNPIVYVLALLNRNYGIEIDFMHVRSYATLQLSYLEKIINFEMFDKIQSLMTF